MSPDAADILVLIDEYLMQYKHTSFLAKDTRLREIVDHHGAKNWRMVAEQLGTLRSDVQCLHRQVLNRIS